MSNSDQFTATGPGSAGFQTTGSSIEVGANVAGKSAGGVFHATASGPGLPVAGVTGDSAYGSGFLGGNANDDATSPDRPRGVFGESDVAGGIGVEGIGAFCGVAGQMTNNPFTLGFLGGRDPVFHESAGAFGQSPKQGVTGMTTTDNPLSTGVYGFSQNGGGVGIRGETVTGVAVQGKTFGSGLAGKFVGNVEVNGNLRVDSGEVAGILTVDGDIQLRNRDVAERFEAEVRCEAGSVMVLGPDAILQPCALAYDKRAVGVISGAGTLRPAITLGDVSPNIPSVVIALIGTAYCRVDADIASIEVGDLLTTSETIGHAMKALDQTRSFGSVVGKALAPLTAGRGLIPIVVALQ